MIYNKKKKTWRECRMYNGEKYDLSAKSKEELMENIARKKMEIDEGRRRMSRAAKASEWSDEYITAYRLDEVTPEHEVNLRCYQKHADDFFGNMKCGDIRQIHCIKFAAGLSKYSRSHARKILQFVIAMFTAAVNNGVMLENPASGIKIPKLCTDGERRALTDTERAQFLEFAESHPHGLWIKIMIWCGLRSGETERIYGKHVDIENRRLWVDGTKSKKAKRWVPIPDAIFGDLEKFASSPTERVFTNQRGSNIDKSTRKRMWKAFIRELNIYLGARVYRNELQEPLPIADDLTAHCLRHTFASYAEEQGVPLRIIGEWMGHEEMKTTKGYTHMTDTTFQNNAALLNENKNIAQIEDLEVGAEELQEALEFIRSRKLAEAANNAIKHDGDEKYGTVIKLPLIESNTPN